MTDQHPSPDAAYGRAHADVTALLASHGAPNAHAIASEVLATLTRQGWAWRRRETPPVRGRAADPAVKQAAIDQARADLALLLHAQQTEGTPS